MQYRALVGTRRPLMLAALCLLAGVREGAAQIAIGQPLQVRILYDHSGSMHPGYTPPGTPERRTRQELGVRYFHEYPVFQQWLGDFAARQTVVDGGRLGMWTFASGAQFAPADIQLVHDDLPIDQFDVARAVQRFSSAVGQTTYLTEALDQFTRGFDGLVWLITDNIVETRAGEPNADVQRFFAALRDVPRYRSVHLFKYPFRDDATGQTAALAVYGILVSEADLPTNVLEYYDRKFRSGLRSAERRQGDPPLPLFPERQYLKLKDLRVDIVELQALNVELKSQAKGPFSEGQNVQLELSGKIKSNLTQHWVTGGSYRLELATPLQPEAWARRDLGLEPIPPAVFQPASDSIRDPIPPEGTRDLRVLLRSTRPISVTGKGLAAWFRLAFNPAVVTYAGQVRMSFQDVQVRLEREAMNGIFGIGLAPGIFDIQDVKTLDQVSPSEAPVSFALETSSNRTVLLLALGAIVAGIVALLALVLARKEWYRIRITGTPEKLIALRRLAGYDVVHDGQILGRLSRKMSDYDFTPNAGSAAFQIKATQTPDTWDVRFRDGRGCQLSIEPKTGRKHERKPVVSDGPGAKPVGPPISGPSASGPPAGGAAGPGGPGPVRRPLKIDRP